MGFPWDSRSHWESHSHAHISTDYLMQQQVFIEHEQMHGDCMDQLIRNPLPEWSVSEPTAAVTLPERGHFEHLL